MPPDPDNDVYDFREGFDTRLIDMNRTCKVTKGGQVVKYTAMVAYGNYNGVIGFAKAKGPAVPVALQKDIIQSMPHDAHPMGVLVNSMSAISIFHPADANPALRVIGSRNPHNTVKVVFKALNAIETPRDVQEKFGRTVVEKYLL
ncbi:hypothetical protein Fmac_021242 [Flemingia macrophylla]|uniref:S5 DRBM domain-containing protein n=1 Tax=Flemingia macrophylla TaxID=520843 RepID=A0ABD1LY03_9FABA